MKILFINGSPHLHGCVDRAQEEMRKVFRKLGDDTETIWIGTGAVNGCIDCGSCRKSGWCIFDSDPANRIIEAMEECDGLVIGSPVYFAGPNGALLALLDRVFYAYDKSKLHVVAGASVVSCRRGGASATFDRLNKYFTIREIPVVSSVYWNSVHGNTPAEVEQDLEGLSTMRQLAKNMHAMIAAIDKAALERPEHEDKVRTNFIR